MSGAYRSYWGACENKSHAPLTIVVECHPDAGPDATMPDPASAEDGWDAFGLTCPVCGDTVPGGFEGADETTTWERADKARGAVGFRERLTMADYLHIEVRRQITEGTVTDPVLVAYSEDAERRLVQSREWNDADPRHHNRVAPAH